MNLKQFKYVLTVSKAKTISKAAEELNISQPSLSQYIKKIETQLNIELFDRTNGNFRLTDAGKVYVDTARQILSLEKQMQNKFIDIKDNKCGTVTIGTTPFRSATMMPLIVSKFRKKYPNISIVIVEQGTQELKIAAERGEFDLCIVTLPVSDKSFNYELIMEEELVLAVPRASELEGVLSKNTINADGRKFAVINPQLLDGQEFVMVTETQIMQKALENLCKDYNINLKSATVVKSLEAQIKMVAAGVGTALVPTGLIKYADIGEQVSYYSIDAEMPKRTVAAVYPRNKYLPEIIVDLIKVIKEIDWK